MSKIGVNNYTGNIILKSDDVLEGIKELVNSGFEIIQIYTDMIYDEGNLEEIRRYGKEKNVKYYLHGTLGDVNLASFNKKVQKQSVETLKSNIEVASYIGSDLMTFHPGRYSFPFSSEVQKLQHPRDELLENLMEVLPGLVSYADMEGVQLSVENCPTHKELGRPDEIKDITSEGCSFSFDLQHANQSDPSYLERFMEEFIDEMVLVHLPPDPRWFEGVEKLRNNGYKGDYILELEDMEKPQTVSEAKKILEGYLSTGR